MDRSARMERRRTTPTGAWLPGRRCLLAACLAATSPALPADWLPIPPEDLAMTSEPGAPKASAVYLYRQVDRNDDIYYAPSEAHYDRIKILTEEGRNHANVKILYNKRESAVVDIAARTIHADGTIIEFDGKVIDEAVVESNGVNLQAKVLALPDVQVGSIIEYRFRYRQNDDLIYNSHWILSQDLFTRDAKFSLNPYRGLALRYSWPQGLPPGTKTPPQNTRGIITFETHDIPAFVSEEFMPPADEMKYRVDFIYASRRNVEREPAKFWKKFGQEVFRSTEAFMDARRAMEQAVAQIVSPGDTPDQKLRAIYARVQQLRNLSYEPQKMGQEEARETRNRIHHVDDVWHLGYGYERQLNWLFAALVRAAGFRAEPVLVATRDRYFFDERFMNPNELNAGIVAVHVDGKDLYLTPGVPFAPFGVLPWNETFVKGLRLDKDGGSWVDTPTPSPADARIAREAHLKLGASGDLEGTVTVTYGGLEAVWRKVAERDEDDAGRRQFLERQLQADIPVPAEVTLTEAPTWSGSDQPMVAEFRVSIPGWATLAGQRALMPAAVFGATIRHTFEHATRVHPIYLHSPQIVADDVSIELPAGWQQSGPPAQVSVEQKNIAFHIGTTSEGNTLRTRRDLMLDLIMVEPKYYDPLRAFFQKLKTADEAQLVISTSTPTTRH